MPQIDIFTFDSQVLPFIFIFVFFYFALSVYLLPQLLGVLSARKKIKVKFPYKQNFFFNIAFSPLEQFEIISLVGFSFFDIDLYIVNSFFLLNYNFILLIIILAPFYFKFKLLPNSFYQVFVENLYLMIARLLVANAGYSNQIFFPLIFTLSCVLSFCNIIGLFPFGFTLTSHIIITFFFSFTLFTTINIIGVMLNKFKIFALFMPSGTPFLIMPFLFVIEVLSYFSRLFSLAIRLFANMMSGHTLLKILISFSFSFFSYGGINVFINIFPIILLHVIIFMEFCIALLQVYVFVVLSCIYMNDVTHVSH